MRGIKCIPASMLDLFSYIALEHLYIPQSVSRKTIRYSGSPLKYSTSEHFAGSRSSWRTSKAKATQLSREFL